MEGSEPSFIPVCCHTTPQIIVHKVPFDVRYQDFETFKLIPCFAPFLLNLFLLSPHFSRMYIAQVLGTMSVAANFLKLPHIIKGWPFEVDHLDAIMLLSKAPDQMYGDWFPIPWGLLERTPARPTGAGPPEHLVPETRLLRCLPSCDVHPRPHVLGSVGHRICTSHERSVASLAHRTTVPW